MTNFDGTIDNRWRPDFESSQRRVREETGEVVYSRELAFVPARRKSFEAHDAQTAALIRRIVELERLPHGELVSQMLEEWRWMDKMKGPDEKQRYLEPLIETVRRDPLTNEAKLIFLMLAFEPVRRSVSSAFTKLHAGLSPQPRDVNWGNREEARMVRHIERERLFDVTREAALEAVFRYPTTSPTRFFVWLRETIAHRALDKLRGELPEAPTCGASGAAAEAMALALAGFEDVAEPEMRDKRGLCEWRSRIAMRDVYEIVDQFFSHDPVCEACRAAIGRLPRAQREAVDGYFFQGLDVGDIATRRGVSESTVYNQKAVGQNTLRDDDVFFSALSSLHRVRDHARDERLTKLYPDGVLPDGRRLVKIRDAA